MRRLWLGLAIVACWNGGAMAMRWPSYGGTLSFAFRGTTPGAARHFTIASDAMLFAARFDSLYRVSRDGRVQPNLVEDRGELDATHNTWTLKLRTGLHWSDGRPLLARDVVKALRHLPIWIRQPFSAISAPSARTIRLRLRFPVPHRLQLLAHIAAAIVKPRLNRHHRRSLVGCGMFRMLRKGSDLLLVPNRWYHRGRPYLNGIKLLQTVTSSTESDRFYLDQIDATLVPSTLYSRKRRPPRETVAPLEATIFLLFNTRSSTFGNIDARRAAWASLNLGNLRRFVPYPARVARTVLPTRYRSKRQLSQPSMRGRRLEASQPIVLIFDRDRPGHQALAKAVLGDISNGLQVGEIRFLALDSSEFKRRLDARRGFDIALVETLHLTRSRRVALAALMHQLTPSTPLLSTIHNGSLGIDGQLRKWLAAIPFVPLLHLHRTLYHKPSFARVAFRGDGLLDLFELFLDDTEGR
ncbi:MAG: hypothetical protein KC609_02850 [Myxococcales bacterium]|nr:hypothetical protein [Myxococcales bacterium]